MRLSSTDSNYFGEWFQAHGLAEGSIHSYTERSDIVDYYGDPMMPMKLRVLGDRFYGKGFM
jgi:hypothetical protein